MSYYFTTQLNCGFDEAIQKVTEKLGENGFGVLTEIDVTATLKKKIDADLYNYRILGACHPASAFRAIQAEDKIGLMLPCNVIVQQKDPNGPIEVSGIDPIASMQAVENQDLGALAQEIQGLMKTVISELN